MQSVLTPIRELWASQGDSLETNKQKKKLPQEATDEPLTSVQVLIALDWVYNSGAGDPVENEK